VPGVNAQAVDTTTPFTWSACAGVCVVMYLFQSTRTAFVVVTTRTAARIPDLRAFGGPALPTAAAGTWSVRVHAPFRTIDDALDPARSGFVDAYSFGLPPLGEERDGTLAMTRERAFTTK
jgi:hypothetical protein